MTRSPAKAEPSAPTDDPGTAPDGAPEQVPVDACGPMALDARAKRRVERAAGDLRRGTPVVVTGAQAAVLALTVETAEPEGRQLLASQAGGVPELAVTAMRARALGLDVPADAAALRLRLHGGPGADGALALADPTGPEAGRPPRIAGQEVAGAPTVRALELAKLARLLPAALVTPVPGADAAAWQAWAAEHDLIAVPAAEVAAYRARAAADLHPVASARVPLADAEDARVHAFRPHDGGPEHFAIVIGAPSGETPVLARLHSECFTGDLLGSLRCDCGDQLRGAIEAIAEAGSGVLLYLAQEGRGIGLVNKLRAYQLQDAGADTLEANTALGFDADERVYLPAAEMLRRLGFDRVRLMTNNPEKVEALAACGIEVSERVPHHFPSNDHNELYLDTKARRFGHLY